MQNRKNKPKRNRTTQSPKLWKSMLPWVVIAIACTFALFWLNTYNYNRSLSDIISAGQPARTAEKLQIYQLPDGKTLQVKQGGVLAKLIEAMSDSIDLHGRRFTLSELRFQDRSATIIKSTKDVVEQLSEILDSYSTMTIRIESHENKLDGDATTKELTDKRANRIKSELIALGIDPSRIETLGMGHLQPLVQTTDQRNENANRRIDIFITSK